MAAGDRGPLMHAHVGMMRALHRQVEPEIIMRAKTSIGEAQAGARSVM